MTLKIFKWFETEEVYLAAVNSASELRTLCREQGVHRPLRTWFAKPGSAEGDVALGRPGQLVRHDYESDVWYFFEGGNLVKFIPD